MPGPPLVRSAAPVSVTPIVPGPHRLKALAASIEPAPLTTPPLKARTCTLSLRPAPMLRVAVAWFVKVETFSILPPVSDIEPLPWLLMLLICASTSPPPTLI